MCGTDVSVIVVSSIAGMVFELLQYILYDCSGTPSYQTKPGLFFKLVSIVVGFFVLFLFLNFQSAIEIYM